MSRLVVTVLAVFLLVAPHVCRASRPMAVADEGKLLITARHPHQFHIFTRQKALHVVPLIKLPVQNGALQHGPCGALCTALAGAMCTQLPLAAQCNTQRHSVRKLCGTAYTVTDPICVARLS